MEFTTILDKSQPFLCYYRIRIGGVYIGSVFGYSGGDWFGVWGLWDSGGIGLGVVDLVLGFGI